MKWSHPLAAGLVLMLAACSHDSDLKRLRDLRAEAPGVEDAGPDSDARPACEVVAPLAGTLLQKDDLDSRMVDGLNFEVTVETDAAGSHRPILVFVDGSKGPSRSAPTKPAGGGRHWASIGLRLEDGPHTLRAECESKSGVVTESEAIEWDVDTTPCIPEITGPAADTVVTTFDDLDAEREGLQLRIDGALTGPDCAGYTAYVCEEGEPGPRLLASQAEGSFAHTITLGESGANELCVSAHDDAGNVVTSRRAIEHRVCKASDVLCESDLQCHSDTDRDPEFCGPDCQECPDLDDGRGVGVCVEGKCTVQCEEGYVPHAGGCSYRPSCKGLQTECNGESCCMFDAIAEPNGEPLRVQRGYDESGVSTGIVGWVAKDKDLAVTVDDFLLDRYEVTVGRFRRFLDDYEAWIGGAATVAPRGGQGRHPAVPASGWQQSWGGRYIPDSASGRTIRVLPVDRADFASRLGNCAPSTWTDDPEDQEDLPLNCVNFYEAFLFCLYESGRLPTEAEWIVAAAGGRQQRAFPWSDPPSSDLVSAMSAVYGGAESEGPLPAGSRPQGVARWGTHDLGGNLYEWTRDTLTDRDVYATGPSNPIALDEDDLIGKHRVARGGSYKFGPDHMRTSYRDVSGGANRINDLGFRCAYPGVNDND